MIVLDANILIRAVLGKRVRQIIEKYAEQQVRFFAPDVAFADAEKYLPPLLKKRGKPHEISGAMRYFREVIEPVAPEIYIAFESEARLRLRGRDEDDWPVLASALALACDVWTEDAVSLEPAWQFGLQTASRFFSKTKPSPFNLKKNDFSAALSVAESENVPVLAVSTNPRGRVIEKEHVFHCFVAPEIRLRN